MLGVVLSCESLCVGEAGNSHGDGAVVAASGDDRVRIAVLYGPVGLSDGMRGGCAGCDYVYAGALGSELYGYLACGHVADHRGDEHRGNPLPAGVVNHFHDFALDGVESADAGAHIGAEAVRVYVFSRDQSRVLHSLEGRRHSINGEQVPLAQELPVHPIFFRMEVAYHSAYLDGQFLDGEVRYEVYSADSVLEIPPERADIVSHAGQDSKSGNNNSFFHMRCALVSQIYAKISYICNSIGKENVCCRFTTRSLNTCWASTS